MPQKDQKILGISKKTAQTLIPVLIVALSAVTAAVLVMNSAREEPKNKTELVQSAPADACSRENQVTFSCYKKELSTITANQGPQVAFSLVKTEYEKVPYVKSQCHQLAHVIGRAAYVRYGNITDTFAQGDQFCWSGYYHGAMEQLTDEKGYDYTLNNANDICKGIAEKQRYSFYHYNCVHGLGHGFMFVIEGGDVFKALSACDKLTDSWEAQSCWGGVFMQNIMNAQGPDADPSETPKYLRASEPMYPCTAVAEKYKQQCYLMQTSYALQTVGYNFAKVFGLCDGVEQTYRLTCYASVGRDASGQSISDAERTKATCMLGSSVPARTYCIQGAAKDFVSYFHSDIQAKQLCSILEISLQSDCYQTVTSYYATF